MHYRHPFRRLAAVFLAVVLLTSFIVPASAANWNMTYFLRKYSDWHFDLSKSPNNPMTYEEYIAIAYAYSYYGGGTTATPAKDITGKAPSAWAARYVQAEAAKKTFTPSEVNYTANVTLADVAQFLARAKGKYAYDYNNVYTFTGTSGLSAEDKMYLNVAVDHNLIAYTPGMNVSQTILRKDAQKYLVPQGTLTCKPVASTSTPSMKEMNVYFENPYDDTVKGAKTLAMLKNSTSDISMVTFAFGYLSSTQPPNDGKSWLRDADVIRLGGTAENSPVLAAVQYCRDTNKLALLGISNAAGDGFDKVKPHDMLASTATMDQAILEILDSVNTYEFDGVNLGFEHLYDADRSNFATFITRLSNALHQQGKVLMTTVGAYHSAALETASCYDYSTIGKASDYVHIILYDDYPDTAYAYTKKLGAMSNYVRIGRCLRYASNAMDPGKIVLGMSTMTTDYNTTKFTGKDTSYEDSEKHRIEYGASLVWDSDSAGAHFNYTVSTGNDAGNHVVYLESVTGLEMRAKLAYSYGIGGVSFYHLGSGYTQAYPAVSKLSSYKPEIMNAISTGIVPNSLRGQYRSAITRGEFCKLIATFLEQYYGKTLDEIVEDQKGTEVSFSDTHDADVLHVAALGIVTGMGEGKFAPNNSISRQQAATMLARLADVVGCKPNTSEVTFTDAAAIAGWAQDSVAFISACQDPTNSKRVMGGTGAGQFAPKGSYTRGQSIMTLIRLYDAAKA